jgi:lipopolysaccharide/colanic/teichoic acid biosynthesis glycosyltransferase
MAGRHREHDLVAEEGLERDTTVAPSGADDAELELAPGDLVDDRLGVGDGQRDPNARVQLLELAEDEREDRAAGTRRGTDLEPAGQLALGLLAELLEELLLQREQALRTAVQPLAGLGRLNPPSGAVEQSLAESLLERADLETDSWLRDTELVGRLREAPPLDHRAERRQLPRIHKQTLSEISAYDPSVPETTTRVEDTLVRGYRQLALETPARRRDIVLRALDIALSLLFLVVALPLAGAIALLVLTTGGLPVLYRGERVGRGGRVFTMYKFRTLRRGAEERLGPYLGEELVRRTETEFAPMGRWLKATQLDEIPQFWNVLRGDMSLVGPRPIRPVFFEELSHELPAYWQRLVVRPGLTGLAQVRRGYETSMAEKLAHDLEWIADRSVRLYLRTVAATGVRVVRQSLRGLFRPDA